MKAIRIYIVDDHQMLIDGIKALLGSVANIEIIGTNTKPATAIEEILTLVPDVVLTDISMPEISGLELTSKVLDKNTNIKIIAVSMHGDRAIISDMLTAGVSGYILKNTGKDDLVKAIEKVANGGMFFSEEVSAELMKAITTSKSSVNGHNLTKREVEIVQLIAKEFSNAEIAIELFISERTVETHRKNIFRKTETKSIVGLIKFAFEHKMVE